MEAETEARKQFHMHILKCEKASLGQRAWFKLHNHGAQVINQLKVVDSMSHYKNK